MKLSPKQLFVNSRKVTLLLFLISYGFVLKAQVQLRDTSILWQHHAFELNSDYSLKNYSTDDADIEQVTFANAKVIENELIRLVILPEYGARVLSFVYKPTGHEYLYQSECGTPYEIGNNIFYYDWLMVYGGIFPTFPEPEHGKTWLLPWKFSVLKNTADTVTVRMELTDSTSFSGAPFNYSYGITNITCQVDISVYRNSSIWDFDVKLINNENQNVNYEYWTCTTLTPGSEIGKTGSPLNSEIVIPVEQYFAAWSPGGWIGSGGSRYDLDRIDYLSEWNDMGIAYAHNFKGDYWGVINHENEEGIFRVSENVVTPGVKLWTWGKQNIDNNLYDFSNGGADNYIELWAGVSEEFFKSATIKGNEIKSWKESYCPTVNISSISDMSNYGAVNLIYDEADTEIKYELNTFLSDEKYTVNMTIEGEGVNELITNNEVSFEELGQQDSFLISYLNLPSGDYTVYLDLLDDNNEKVLAAEQTITVQSTTDIETFRAEAISFNLYSISNNVVRLNASKANSYHYVVNTINGQFVLDGTFSGNKVDVKLPTSGLYIITLIADEYVYTKKTIAY